jgi:hypothetical protein
VSLLVQYTVGLSNHSCDDLTAISFPEFPRGSSSKLDLEACSLFLSLKKSLKLQVSRLRWSLLSLLAILRGLHFSDFRPPIRILVPIVLVVVVGNTCCSAVLHTHILLAVGAPLLEYGPVLHVSYSKTHTIRC